LLVTGCWLLVWRELPNINIQNTNKFQCPIFNIQTELYRELSFEYLGFIWNLDSVIWDFMRIRQPGRKRAHRSQSSIVNGKW
jgi:hypothetical protein